MASSGASAAFRVFSSGLQRANTEQPPEQFGAAVRASTIPISRSVKLVNFGVSMRTARAASVLFRIFHQPHISQGSVNQFIKVCFTLDPTKTIIGPEGMAISPMTSLIQQLASNAPLLSAVAATVAVLVAIATLTIQGRRARTLLRIDVLFRFDNQFNSEQFRKIRSSAAFAVSKKAEDFRDVDEVLDFFDTMGLMARKGALDLEMVWSTFYLLVDGWWNATAGYVRESQADDELTWEYFVELWQSLTKIEKKKTGSNESSLTWSREEVTWFIDNEQKRVRPMRRKKAVTKKIASPVTSEGPREVSPETQKGRQPGG